MEQQATSLPSVASFLGAAKKANAVLRLIVERDIPDVFPLRSLYGNEVIGRIEQLKEQASRLRQLESLLHLPAFRERPSTFQTDGGLMSVDSGRGLFGPEAYLQLIEAEFAEWTFGNGQRATELRCRRGFCLYHLGHEIRSFQSVATTLRHAVDAGEDLLKVPSDKSLRLRVRKGIRGALDLHAKEFTVITRRGTKGMSEEFVLRKIASYNEHREELAGLAAVWAMRPDEIVGPDEVAKGARLASPHATTRRKDAPEIVPTEVPLTPKDPVVAARYRLKGVLAALKPASSQTPAEKAAFIELREEIESRSEDLQSASEMNALSDELHLCKKTPDALTMIRNKLRNGNQNDQR